MVRYTPLREITDKEKNRLYTLLDTNPEIRYRIKIILLANDGYTVPEIREMTNTYTTEQLENGFINSTIIME